MGGILANDWLLKTLGLLEKGILPSKVFLYSLNPLMISDSSKFGVRFPIMYDHLSLFHNDRVQPFLQPAKHLTGLTLICGFLFLRLSNKTLP